LAFVLPIWLLRGRAHLKQQLAGRTSLPTTGLPIHEKLLGFLKQESKAGRRLILCSASNERLVCKVATQLEFPVEVMASDGAVNLKGERKARALTERFGEHGFDYAGNDRDDLPVWNRARRAIVVNASPRVERAAQGQGNVTLVLPRTRNAVSVCLKAIRPRQWV